MEITPIRWPDFMQIYKLWMRAGLKLSEKETERQEFLDMIRLNGDSCLKLVSGGKIVGSAFGTWNGRRAWIYHFAIDPNFQGKGFGKILLGAIAKILKQKGAKKINLGVLVENQKVVPFYQKQGFSMVDDQVVFGKEL